jgi:hypothetical protein
VVQIKKEDFNILAHGMSINRLSMRQEPDGFSLSGMGVVKT